MVSKQPPRESDNTVITDCSAVVCGIRRAILKNNPHYQKRNEEFHASKKKKIKENLNQYLLDDKIIKDFVQQLDGKKVRSEGVNPNWPAWKYYAYDSIFASSFAS